jgi:hypothetical protein
MSEDARVLMTLLLVMVLGLAALSITTVPFYFLAKKTTVIKPFGELWWISLITTFIPLICVMGNTGWWPGMPIPPYLILDLMLPLTAFAAGTISPFWQKLAEKVA